MRNVFDQYTQPENQLTHALVVTLHQDRSVLLKPFLEWMGANAVPDTRSLQIVEQQRPGVMVSGDEFDGETRKGLPDASIFNEDGWALIVESKVQAPLNNGQLHRHRLTAQRCGFSHPQLFAIVVDRNEASRIRGATVVEWREIYSWFRLQRQKSLWAQHFSEYLEIFEAKNLADNYNIRGTLTMFDGLHFDDEHPFHYREAKRLLRLLGEELRANPDLKSLGVNQKALGRGKITGSQGTAVWDYLQFKGCPYEENFNKWPHLTFALRAESAGAFLNFPNQLQGGLKTLFRQIGPDRLREILEQVERGLRPLIKRVDGSAPYLELVQRHYPSRTAPAIVDGRVHADLRTLSKAKSSVKHQPEWLDSAFELVANKNSNLQFGISVRFPYESKIVRSRNIIQEFANAWVAMKPLIEIGLIHVKKHSFTSLH